jgi:hypothetical protein
LLPGIHLKIKKHQPTPNIPPIPCVGFS